LESYSRLLRHVHPYTDGFALRELNLPPGPHYREILARLRAAWLEGAVTSEEEELILLQELLANLPDLNRTAYG